MRYHQSSQEKNGDRISVLSKIQDKYDYTDISFPASYDDIARFENQNKVCVYVYIINEEGKLDKERDGNIDYIQNDIIYLLRIEQEENSHYVYIKHIDRLLNIHTHVDDKGKKFCPMCSKKIAFSDWNCHISKCYDFCKNSTALKLPPRGSRTKFKNHKNMLQRPFLVFADLESVLKRLEHPQGDEEATSRLVSMHKPCAAGFYFVCTFDPTRNFYWEAVGENCIHEMIVELKALAERCMKEMRQNERMVMTQEDKRDFYRAKCCHICKGEFGEHGDAMVRDHDHRTGSYRGAAHSKCNINYFTNRYLPVIFHNLKGYDSHHIIREAHRINQDIGQKEIKAIPNSYEKFMSFSIGDLKFIDSFQFMSSSLEKLSENLYDEQERYKHFHSVRQFFPDSMDLVCQKGFFPYEWLDSFERLNHQGLPPLKDFYSSLRKEGVSEEDYRHAQKVYTSMNCGSFKDYMLLYLKTDVLLLADVFSSFRDTCITYYKLDPANYLSAPALAWDAMLLKTGIELDQITDIRMLDFVEKMKRGGLCFVGSKRHVKANNKYLADFDMSKPSTYPMHWDANNLYGWAMSQVLPYRDLKFTRKSLEDVLATPDDAQEGYAVKCWLRFPRELHDKFKEFPPAPENLTPDMEWFSDYQREQGQKL